jgi:hypothetical protein
MTGLLPRAALTMPRGRADRTGLKGFPTLRTDGMGESAYHGLLTVDNSLDFTVDLARKPRRLTESKLSTPDRRHSAAGLVDSGRRQA